MRVLQLAIFTYIAGLLTFYVFAVFDTRAWNIAYFGWCKASDAGLLIWAAFYYTLKSPHRNIVRWLYVFSIFRFIGDVQSFFTGVGVNNEILVAILFLILISVTTYLTLYNDSKPSKWLAKHLNL